MWIFSWLCICACYMPDLPHQSATSCGDQETLSNTHMSKIMERECVREMKSKKWERNKSLKWDSKERSAQIDIAITKKATPLLGIHLHTLVAGCSPTTVSEANQAVSHTKMQCSERSSRCSHCVYINNQNFICSTLYFPGIEERILIKLSSTDETE